MRLALVATMLFATLWFVALKPKPIEAVDEPAPAPKAATPAKPATPAQTAVKPVRKAATPAPKPKRVVPATGPERVLADIKANKVVVLLFWDPKARSPEDRVVREELKAVDRRDGRVKVHTASISQLRAYEQITKAAMVAQSPTVLVIDREAQARMLEGLTVTREIDTVVDRILDGR